MTSSNYTETILLLETFVGVLYVAILTAVSSSTG